MASKQTYWTHIPLLQAVERHIQEGILCKSRKDKEGIDYLFEAIRKEFKDFFDKENHRFTMTSLKAKLPELIWDSVRSKQMETYVRENRDVADIAQRFSCLPKSVLDAKIRYLRARGGTKTPAQHVRGIFRIIPDGTVVKPITMPETSKANPIIIPDSANVFLPVGAPMLGLPYPGTMSENQFR